MQTNQNVPRPFSILSQAIAYLLGGMFLFNTSSIYLAGRPALIGQIFGGIFMGVAFFLVISSFFDNLVALANRINRWLFLALFIVAMASLFTMAVKSTEYLTFYIVLAVAFALIVIAAMLFQLRRTGTSLITELGARVVSARLLRVLSVVLSLFALAMVIAQVNIIGGPILYLAIGLVCLGVASLLQRTV